MSLITVPKITRSDMEMLTKFSRNGKHSFSNIRKQQCMLFDHSFLSLVFIKSKRMTKLKALLASLDAQVNRVSFPVTTSRAKKEWLNSLLMRFPADGTISSVIWIDGSVLRVEVCIIFFVSSSLCQGGSSCSPMPTNCRTRFKRKSYRQQDLPRMMSSGCSAIHAHIYRNA